MISSNKILSRKPKNKFIHKDGNDWSRCYITKINNSVVYVSKINQIHDSHVQVKSYVKSEEPLATNIPIFFDNKIIELLPRQLVVIVNSIEKSKYILDLEDDWDGEGAKKYNIETWRKTVSYIVKLSTKIFRSTGYLISAPQIYHGPKGSIDVYWETTTFNLLLNFPEDGVGTFYGDDYRENKSEGFFDLADININVLPFLVEYK